MPSRPPYPAEYKAELVRLVREEGRTPGDLAREFEPSAQSITNWVAQAEIDAGKRPGLTTDGQAELRRLRQENRVLPMEKEILEKAARPSSRRRTTRPGDVLRVHRGGEGQLPDPDAVPSRRCDPSGFYAWRRRPPCQRRITDAASTAVIKRIVRYEQNYQPAAHAA